ncbi:MAG: hypothetical protein Tsb0010_06210 [Parvularculaceae bacterium]
MMIRHENAQLLCEYWKRLRDAQGRPPARSQIEPRAVKTALPSLFFLERRPEGGFRFRLAGTALCALYGEELRGADFARLWRPQDADAISALLRDVIEHGEPGMATAIAGERGARIDLEWVFAPLRNETGVVDRIIGSANIVSQRSERRQVIAEPMQVFFIQRADRAPKTG